MFLFLSKNSLYTDLLLSKKKIKKNLLKTVIFFINLYFISFFSFVKLNNFEKKIFKFIYLIYSIISLLFSKKLPLLFKSKHKKRTYKIFKFFKRKKKFFRLKSLNNYRLFINNIKIVNFFMRKCVSKYRRESRKEYYKKLKEKNNRMKVRLKLLKKIFKRSSIQKTMKKFWYFQERNLRIFLSKYRRIHNNYICFNNLKLPFTRKSENSRMGKGKGKIKN
jgi:hypothetical protein